MRKAATISAIAPLSDALDFSSRFVRSTELERDFNDPHALMGYRLTEFAATCLRRIAEGFGLDSSQRAWRLTGDYGSGKSSFALLLAQAVHGEVRLPADVKRELRRTAPGLLRARYVPVLVVGMRVPMGVAILRRLETVLNEQFTRGAKSTLTRDIEVLLQKGPTDDEVLAALSAANEKIIQSGKGEGIILILDEVGKFLEYAAANPRQHDVMLLQRLAEMACRSRKDPFHVICLLHQGFNAYADQLSRSSAREWEKVAGRFEEITFRQPLDQLTALVAGALQTRVGLIPAPARMRASSDMEAALKLGWYGSGVTQSSMQALALSLYPLDPCLLPVAARIFARFGQNERSLFSFIFSHEPFSLREYSQRPLAGAEPYRLHNLYDYVRANMGGRLSAASYRSRWNVIEAVVDGHSSQDPKTASERLARQAIKTIGLLNLIAAEEIRPTADGLCMALGGAGADPDQILEILTQLTRQGRVFFRGRERGYCLWPYTSVDIERAVEEAKRTIPNLARLDSTLRDYLSTRPIVARRHYIETGNLRYFDVIYCAPDKLQECLNDTENNLSDGSIIVPLCQDGFERDETLASVPTLRLPPDRISLLAVPQPLESLKPFVLEAQMWDHILEQTAELNRDSYARQEVLNQKNNARHLLDVKLQEFVGLNRLSGETTLTWFVGHEPAVELQKGRNILARLSTLCDAAYREHAPMLRNELVNRHNLSSSAAAARMRLVERILTRSEESLLGMDAKKRPPEMSMYLSVLRATGIHTPVSGNITGSGPWRISIPDPSHDPVNVGPALRCMRDYLMARADRRVPVTELYRVLGRQPYGLREGLLPLFLSIIAVIHRSELAFYETGTFISDANSDLFMRLSKAPERFDVQFCRIDAVRSDIFNALCQALALPSLEGEQGKLLYVVAPLCQFVASLSDYARKTKSVSGAAIQVRECLLTAREPVRLIFHSLPVACGVEPFEPGQMASSARIEEFVSRLKAAIEELKLALPALRRRISDRLQTLFQLSGAFSRWRRGLADRATSLLADVREPRLNAFCFRLTDEALGEDDWLDSVGSFVMSKPPAYWLDRDTQVFEIEVAQLSIRFQRVEGIVRQKNVSADSQDFLRLAVTRLDGREIDRIFHVDGSQKQEVANIRQDIAAILAKHPHLGLLAAAEEFMAMLLEEEISK